jgi:UDP-glucuronate 4-epimerase
MRILVTGAAGFIGFHTSKALLDHGHEVIGLDNLNEYYDVRLKQARLKQLIPRNSFQFVKQDVADRKAMADLFSEARPERVVHLAAQAGVRHALDHPHDYIDANITGFMNILEGCRHNHIQHLVFASTSAVYGANTALPFSVDQNVDHPVSLYGATKKANELMAHSYAHLFNLPVTGLRFFTVYGPWGRPDMSLFLFTKKILSGEPIDVFNYGDHSRDFTYIDDIVEGIVRTLDAVPQEDPHWNSNTPTPATSSAPYRIFNIGNNQPVPLMYFIECIEKALGKTASKRMLPLQPGDVHQTYADIDGLVEAVDFKPATRIEDGIQRFVSWYRQYYDV